MFSFAQKTFFKILQQPLCSRGFVLTNQSRKIHDVVVVSAVRTPIGSFMGQLSSMKASQLGAIAVKKAVEKSGISVNKVDEVILGNVLPAGQGQAPARQAAIFAGLPKSVVCTTINKVCASGMKSITLGAQSIMLGHSDVVVAGGFESMSNVPFYVDSRMRSGVRMGDVKMIDGMIFDGLWDVYNQFHMGMCAEDCAKKYNITRNEQDHYSIRSYKRARNAALNGYFKNEIIPVTISSKSGDVIISEDEEIYKPDLSKIETLKPAFDKSGTVTAGNSSKINDGASAVVLTSVAFAKEHNLKPLAKILSFADGEGDPIEFPTAPTIAIPKALQRANLTVSNIDWWEINEAFSVVALVNEKKLGLDPEKLNPLGGGISLGHAIGSSGSRLTTTLIHNLIRTNQRYGCAAICNGGGGATVIVIESIVTGVPSFAAEQLEITS